METAINITVMFFIFLVIILLEKLNKKEISAREIIDYQRKLNASNKKMREKYGVDYKHDAVTEILKERKQTKSFVLIFSGIFLFGVLTIGSFFMIFSFSNIGILCLGAFILICYGIIKAAKSRKVIILLFLLTFVFGTVINYLFDKKVTDIELYFYLSEVLLIISMLLFKSNKKIF